MIKKKQNNMDGIIMTFISVIWYGIMCDERKGKEK